MLKLRGQIIDLRRTIKTFDASSKKKREREEAKQKVVESAKTGCRDG